MCFNSGLNSGLFNWSHIQRDREVVAEANTAPLFMMGLARTGTGPALNPEEILPLVERWAKHLPDL
jgi:hypothetical protein